MVLVPGRLLALIAGLLLGLTFPVAVPPNFPIDFDDVLSCPWS